MGIGQLLVTTTGEIDLHPDHAVIRIGTIEMPRLALTRVRGTQAMSTAWPEEDPRFPRALPGVTVVWADLTRRGSWLTPGWMLGAAGFAEQNCGGQEWILMVRCRSRRQRDRIDRAAAALGITDSVGAVLV